MRIFDKNLFKIFIEDKYQASEAALEKVREMGVKILCTEENAVLPSPFTHKAIQAEIRRYLHIYGSGEETVDRIKNLSEAVVHRMNKAIEAEGSLNWEEVWEIIGDCYSEIQEAEKKKRYNAKNNEKGRKVCQQRNSSARTARKLQS